MDLTDILYQFCSRNSGCVSNEDKKKNSFILKRLFSAQYPMQCELINRLDSDPICSTNIIALLASRYTGGLPPFLKIRVDQKKKKESIYKKFEGDVVDKYMEFNECGIREVEEAYNTNPKMVEDAMSLIKKTFFNNKDKVIQTKPKKEESKSKLF